MKIWTLVWFLVFPADDNGLFVWKAGKEVNLTRTECVELLAERNVTYEHLQVNGEIAGFEIYCKDNSEKTK